MAEKIWVGTTGNWNTAGNWNPSGAPTASDSVHFTGDSVVSVTTGPASAIDYLDLNIHEDYTGTIMSSGTKLLIGSVPSVRFSSRGGKAFIQVGSAEIVPSLVCSSTAGISDMLEIGGAGTWTTVFVLGASGTLKIASSSTVTNFFQEASPSFTTTIETSVSGLTLVRVTSGLLDNSSAISSGEGRLDVGGGRVIHRVGAITDVNVRGSGVRSTFEHHAAATVSNLYVSGSGAMVDGRPNRNPPSVTISNAWAFDQSRLLLRNALDSYTLTNGVITDNTAFVDLEAGGAVQKA